MKLVVYVDFNCPYSALASARGDELVRRGRAEIEWKAVQHEPDIPSEGQPATGDVRADLERDVEETLGQLRAGESFALTIPPVRPNTSKAIEIFAGLAGDEADEMRRRLFDAVWKRGENVGEEDVLESLGASGTSSTRAAAWQQEWLGTEKHIVPMLVLPDGYVSRGLGALGRLAKFVDEGGAPE